MSGGPYNPEDIIRLADAYGFDAYESDTERLFALLVDVALVYYDNLDPIADKFMAIAEAEGEDQSPLMAYRVTQVIEGLRENIEMHRGDQS